MWWQRIKSALRPKSMQEITPPDDQDKGPYDTNEVDTVVIAEKVPEMPVSAYTENDDQTTVESTAEATVIPAVEPPPMTISIGDIGNATTS